MNNARHTLWLLFRELGRDKPSRSVSQLREKRRIAGTPLFMYYQDASILASLLSHDLATRETASHVLSIYSRIRQPLATEVARRSRLNGEHFALRGLVGPDAVSSPRLLLGITKQIQDNFEWVSETDASADLQRAMGLLRAELASA
jgi:hypothetical protein